MSAFAFEYTVCFQLFFFKSFVATNMSLDNTLAKLLENKLVLELPPKHNVIYRCTCMPDLPGPSVCLFFMTMYDI